MFEEQEPKTDFWISYTDLLTGFLAVFVLIVVVLLVSNQKLDDKIGALQAMREQFEKRFDNQPQVKVSEDATIRILTGSGEHGLFLNGDSIITQESKPLLDTAINGFLETLENNYKVFELNENLQIREVRVEGHASRDGTDYLFNLRLSTKRAYSVAEYMLKSKTFDKLPRDLKEELKNKLMVCGYSFSKPLDEKGNPMSLNQRQSKEAQAQSRRVEFRVILESN